LNFNELCERIVDAVCSVYVGDRELIEKVLACCLCNGNILFEDYPGLGKTLLAKVFAKVIGADYKRVQFTPDLLPSDIIGTKVWKKDHFEFIKGPIFTNVLLADEINRSPPKTQSALLEAMEEKQVTVEGETYKLEEPFFVIATQNPIEQEGTYPLPEAQLDRFLMRLKPGYPRDVDEEVEKLYKSVFKITGEEPILTLVTDHGQSSLKEGSDYHVDLVEVLSDFGLNAFTNLDLREYEKRTGKRGEVVIAVSGPRMAHVYTLRRKKDVIEAFKSMDCVDQIFLRDEKEFYHDGMRFSIDEIDKVLGEDYPRAGERVRGLIFNERCGDLIITAKEGYEFEKADYKGGHGSLIYDDSVGFAMIRCGKHREIEECLLTDVIKMVLDVFMSSKT